MTSLTEERAEQQRWTARLRRPLPIYDALLDSEFEPPEQSEANVARALGMMLGFAAQQVPHYRDTLGQMGADTIRHEPRAALAAMPALTKLDVQDAGARLQSQHLPLGDKAMNWTLSSGTTGRQTRVLHSMFSTRMFTLLKQREYRIFRLDPAGTFASMRLAGHLPRGAGGGEPGPGETVRLATWPYMENFTTGSFIGISTMTPMEDRIAWLRDERPQYLMGLAESLELLAIASGAERPAESLRGVIAISEQLTPGMRAFAESRFGTPVHQNYGLNEIGIVAARCEAGRYHVHSEHCLVEIVDESGRARTPGQTGRIVVTGLTNFAMPLIRYDTGDLAEAVAGECLCGRTLPSFGEIVGRYSRIAYLPHGTMGPVVSLRDAIEKMPPELTHDLREFQIHQYRDMRMELRFVARATLPDAFFAGVRAAWAQSAGEAGPSLAVVEVKDIARSAGGKSEVFTSDFMPGRDDKTSAGNGGTV